MRGAYDPLSFIIVPIRKEGYDLLTCYMGCRRPRGEISMVEIVDALKASERKLLNMKKGMAENRKR